MDVKHIPTRQTSYVCQQHAVKRRTFAAFYVVDIRKISSVQDDNLEASVDSWNSGTNRSEDHTSRERLSVLSCHSCKYGTLFV